MKIKKLTLMCLLTLVAASCQSKVEKLTHEYIEACTDGNFEKARAAATKLEAEDHFDGIRALEYVNDKEIYSLLAKPSRDNDARILYLYNTYESYRLPGMEDVVEVAISMDNENLPTKLIKSGVNVTEAMAKAAVNADMEELVSLMLSKNEKVLLDPEVAEYYKSVWGTDSYRDRLIALYQKCTAVYDRDRIVKTAQSENIDEIFALEKKRIAEATEDYKKSLESDLKDLYSTRLPARPSLGMLKIYEGHEDIPEEYVSYKSAVTQHNNACRELMMNALDAECYDVANRALAMMKPNIEWTDMGDWCKVVEHEYDHSSAYEAYKVSENRDEINEARQMLQSHRR